MAINSSNTFYDPNSGYGWDQPSSFDNTEFFRQMARQNPEQYYGYWLGGQGKLGMGVNDDFARSLYSRFRQGFEAAQFVNPNYEWTDHLKQYTGRLSDIAAGIDPQSRGVVRNRYVGGARWLPRQG